MYDAYESSKVGHAHLFVTGEFKFVCNLTKNNEDKTVEQIRLEETDLSSLLTALLKASGSARFASRAMRKFTVSMRNGAKELNQAIRAAAPNLRKLTEKVRAAAEKKNGGKVGKKKKKE